MRLSEIVGRRYKDRPAEATLESHVLLLRGGYARQVANGLFSLLTPGLRVARKIEAILREEMERIEAQEFKLPCLHPREIWDRSGRWSPRPGIPYVRSRRTRRLPFSLSE